MSEAASNIPMILQWAHFYADLGFSIVPTAPGKKYPGLEWAPFQERRATKAEITAWLTGLYSTCGIGLVTGEISGNIIVVDADASEGKNGTENLDDLLMMHDDFPITWSARSGGGGLHYFFRAPPGIIIKNSKSELAQYVDVRGHHGFLVLPPSPHPCGQIYRWIDGVDPATTEIADAPDWLLALCREDAHSLRFDMPGPHLGETSHLTTPSSRQVIEFNKVTNPGPLGGNVGEFNAFGRRIDGREQYMCDLLWARLIEERRECPFTPIQQDVLEKVLTDCWTVFERKVKARSENLSKDGRGIEEMRRKLKYAAKKWDTRIAEEARKPKPDSKSWGEFQREGVTETVAPESIAPLKIVKAFPIEGKNIPRRPWIVRGQHIRNHIAVLVAPPGTCKSLFECHQAIAMAAGVAWGGWPAPDRPMRVLIINSEDDVDEMRRRLVAAAAVMGIDQSIIAENIFLAEQPDTIVIARTDPRTKTVIRTPLVEAIVKTIDENKIDVTVVDPFAETFEGDENSNSELKWAAVLWREIARRTYSGVSLVHHTRKYASGMSGDADAARGAGALIGVARIVATMFDMTDAEAQLFGVPVEDRKHFVRHDDAKANLTLITGAARWFEKRSQNVGNGSVAELGDDVGVLVPWTPPGLLEGVSVDTINKALTIIDEGILDDDGRPTGIRYTQNANSASKTRWAGTVLIDTFGCDEKRAKKIIKEWLAFKEGDVNGLLIEVEFHDGKQLRKGLRVDHEKRPGRVA